MSARAMWKGVLKVGAVSIPVKLYSAVQDCSIRFHLLSETSETRVRQRMVDPETGGEAPAENVRKGYEIKPGTFVIVQPDELQKVEPPPSRDIIALSFVPLQKIAPQWYERPYYLAPSEDHDSYFGLVEALDEKGRAGIAQWVMRKRQYYGAICSLQGHLMLFSLRTKEEILFPDELPAPGKPADPRELRMAEQLIAALEGDFKPEDYRDEYRERLEAFLEEKRKGRTPKLKAVPKRKPPESVLDALTASLKALKKGRKAVA
jgi:DNA end-binding protein Ku